MKSGKSMRILVLSTCVPFPPVGGGPLRTYHLLRAMAREHEVTLVGFTFGDAWQDPGFPIDVVDVAWQMPVLYRQMQSGDSRTAERAAEVLARGIDKPWFVSFYDCDAMADTVRRVSERGFDLVLVEDTDMGQFLPCLPPDVPKLLDLHNVYSLMARRMAIAAPSPRRQEAEHEARRTRLFEAAVARQCVGCIACSNAEAGAARELLDCPQVDAVPNGVDTHYFTPFEAPVREGCILFTGTMNHPPNEEAACYFAEEILPIVRARIPSAELHIAGRDPTPRALALANRQVSVNGYVADMRPFFRDAAVVVVPIRSGGGTRLKILEAGACAKAVVSTSLGAEGLGLVHERHLLIADDAGAFADAVCRLMDDAKLRERLGSSLREACLDFDWTLVESRLCNLLSSYGRQGGFDDVAGP